MIFASDLDRTLIYSKRFIGDMCKDDLVAVETNNNKVTSFMTRESLDLLKEIASNVMLVPITTRTKDQYLRINIFEEEISNKYAVTTNGGSIFIDRKLDTDWDTMIKEKLKDCQDIEKVIEMQRRMVTNPAITKRRVAEDMFFYNVIDLDKDKSSNFDEFDEYLSENGWTKYDQGRKIYYVPDALTKKKALIYIMEREGIKNSLVAGDSLLDLSMLEIASKGFVPLHGELANFLNDDHKKYINLMSEGFKGTEELLNIIRNACNKKL